MYSTHNAVPHLRKRKGKIVVLASTVAWLAMPRMSFYNVKNLLDWNALLPLFFYFLLFSSHIIFYKFLTILSLFLSHKHNLGYANNKINKSVFGPFWSTLSIQSSSVYFSPLRSILVQFDLFQPTLVQLGPFGLLQSIQSNLVYSV